jgi:hypothetical protein
MFRKALHIVSVLAIISVLLASCSSNNPSNSKKSTNSEVIVRRVDSNNMVKLRVYIDGKSAGTLRIGDTARYKIKNGVHTIYATAFDYSSRSTEVSQFTASSSRHVFSITDSSIVFIGEESLTSTFTGKLGETRTLDVSIKNSFDDIARPLKRRAKIAIINIASDNSAEGHYVIEELTAMSVHSPKKFVVMDRRKLEAIRIAKNFDRTSDMEDDFIVSIGHLLGAEVVVTGALNGRGDMRRLWVKALDVKTGVLLGMSSERL